MSSFLGQVLTLVSTPPGNLAYHLVLVFSIAGTLYGMSSRAYSGDFPQRRRIVIGLCVILGMQLLQFLVSGMGWLGIINPTSALPPLDRAVSLLSMVWIAWLWTFPEPMRLADAAMLLLNLIGITAFGLTLAFWGKNPTNSFNQSIYEIAWQIFSLATIVLGGVVLALRRPKSWISGEIMLGLGLVGHLASLFLPIEGNFPGGVRLTELVLYPILLTLWQRIPVLASSAPLGEDTPTETDEYAQERRRYGTDVKAFNALMELAAEDDPIKIGKALTRGIAHAILADLCFLITLSEDKTLAITCGYDLIRQASLDGTNLDRNTIPMLANSIQRGRSLRLPASSNAPDLKGLGEILSLSNPGHLLCVPIISSTDGPLGGILILSPYSSRIWSAEDQKFLSNACPLFLSILERGERIAKVEIERDRAIQDAQEATEQAAIARKKTETLAADLENAYVKTSPAQIQGENIAALIAMQEQAQKTIENLNIGNTPLRGSDSSQERLIEQEDQELRQTLKEMARMQNELGKANIKILELEKHPASPITNEQMEVIAAISQELRQPMSSIVGYSDLLLGESVGGLSTLQRKFVERIKAATERIGGLVDDLVQVTSIDADRIKFEPEPVDLNMVIDNAMGSTSTQIREKNITLRLDITDQAPLIRTDRDAFQQILIHLLQNAAAATPSDGNITLRVHMQKKDNTQYISIQVVDKGGGIAEEDLPLVFARRYRGENSMIQGVGDTGVGLSIARSLVEAQNGSIWVKSEPGKGSTFSVLIPVELSEEK